MSPLWFARAPSPFSPPPYSPFLSFSKVSLISAATLPGLGGHGAHAGFGAAVDWLELGSEQSLRRQLWREGRRGSSTNVRAIPSPPSLRCSIGAGAVRLQEELVVWCWACCLLARDQVPKDDPAVQPTNTSCSLLRCLPPPFLVSTSEAVTLPSLSSAVRSIL